MAIDPNELEPEGVEITEDQDAEDGVPVGQDETPEVREDSVAEFEEAGLAGNPPTDAVPEP